MARNSREEGFHYNNTEKKDKNFMYSNLKRSNCYNCNFAGSNFDYVSFRGAHFKNCSFLNCSFKGAEFVGANLKGSKFKEAHFEDTIFEGVKLDGVNFKDAKFKNTIFVGCDLKSIKNLHVNDKEIRVFEKMPEIEISEELREATLNVMKNECVKKARIFDTKEGKLNLITLMILLENFDEKELIDGLNNIQSELDKDFHTLSYIIKYLKK